MCNCDHCNKSVDERSLQIVGRYLVCLACYHGYSEEELIGLIDSLNDSKGGI